MLPKVTLNGVKGLGVVGSMCGIPSPALRFFVTSFLRMTYKARFLIKEGDKGGVNKKIILDRGIDKVCYNEAWGSLSTSVIL